MTVYIAAPFPMRPAARELERKLLDHGIHCTSRWIDHEPSYAPGEAPEWAQKDCDDVREADCLVLINPEEFKNAGTGGRHFEMGYACALDKPIIVFGVKSNIFHDLEEVAVTDSLDELIFLLERFK